MDVARIEPGADFAESIGKAVELCDVMLVVIGPKWWGDAKAAGERRIDDHGDFVRLEILSALRRKIAVILVLIDGVAAPSRDDLPQELSDLALMPVAELREREWEEDFRSLILLLEKLLANRDQGKGLGAPWPWHRRALLLVPAVMAILVAIGAGTILVPVVRH